MVKENNKKCQGGRQGGQGDELLGQRGHPVLTIENVVFSVLFR